MANTKLAVKAKAGAIKKLEPWEEELKAKAAMARSKEVVGVPRITHKNGILKLDGKKVDGNKITLLIVDYIFTKSYFETGYKDGESSTPVCYAYADKLAGDKGMKPHAAVLEKDRQSESCDNCEHNAFGTALQGRGKRCRDDRKLLCLVQSRDADRDPEAVRTCEMRTTNVPPSSLKSWAGLLAGIEEVSPTGAIQSVAVELTTEAQDQAYTLEWTIKDRLDGETVQALLARAEVSQSLLFAPWPKLEKKEETPEAKERSARRSKKVE
jgi:hypothetical protein